MSLIPFERTRSDAIHVLFDDLAIISGYRPRMRLSMYEMFGEENKALVNIINNWPQINPPGIVVDVDPALIEEVRTRVAAKKQAAGNRLDRTDNKLAWGEPGWERHALDEDFLREHVWSSTLKPFSFEQDLVYVKRDDLPSWINIFPFEAKAAKDLYSPPDAVVGLHLSPEHRRLIRDIEIDVRLIFKSSRSSGINPSHAIDPDFLPLMVCFSRANLESPMMKLPPNPSDFMETTCLAAYSSIVAHRKIQEYARKKAKTAGKEQPLPPPLLIASFSDNYLNIDGIEYVMNMDELDENRGRVFRACQVTSMHVSDNFEAQPLIEVWRRRHFAVENLKAYLDAIASL